VGILARLAVTRLASLCSSVDAAHPDKEDRTDVVMKKGNGREEEWRFIVARKIVPAS
jgi:hypothetical protein